MAASPRSERVRSRTNLGATSHDIPLYSLRLFALRNSFVAASNRDAGTATIPAAVVPHADSRSVLHRPAVRRGPPSQPSGCRSSRGYTLRHSEQGALEVGS